MYVAYALPISHPLCCCQQSIPNLPREPDCAAPRVGAADDSQQDGAGSAEQPGKQLQICCATDANDYFSIVVSYCNFNSLGREGLNVNPTPAAGAVLCRADFESKKEWKAYRLTAQIAKNLAGFPMYVKCGNVKRVCKALATKKERANLRCPEEVHLSCSDSSISQPVTVLLGLLSQGDVTVLMIAARNGSARMVGALVRAGAEVNAVAQVSTRRSCDPLLTTTD
jgi:hypothetical protein